MLAIPGDDQLGSRGHGRSDDMIVIGIIGHHARHAGLRGQADERGLLRHQRRDAGAEALRCRSAEGAGTVEARSKRRCAPSARWVRVRSLMRQRRAAADEAQRWTPPCEVTMRPANRRYDMRAMLVSLLCAPVSICRQPERGITLSEVHRFPGVPMAMPSAGDNSAYSTNSHS